MPRPPSALLKGFPEIQKRTEAAEHLILRPVFLFLRDKNFRSYLKEREEKGLPKGLHVGCAFSPIDGWYNCDLRTWSRAVNFVDATRRLPFPDAAFDYVFTEHFIEHLTLEQGEIFLREAHRVLKPGGVIRTATPSLKFVGELCSAQRSPAHQRYIEWLCREHINNKWPGRPVSHATVINHLFRGWGHQFIYDADFLGQVLGRIGFRGMKQHLPEQSDVPFLKNLERHGKSVPREFNELETFVLEAIR
jgi:predicted SAM-dependent methyltransferase